MEEENNHYHTSFFRPTSEAAKRNRNMVLLLVSIWAIAVFGFQILLKVLEKPVPEPAYVEWETVWPSVKGGQASEEDLQIFAHNLLSVLGKNFIAMDHREALANGLTWTVFQLSDSITGKELWNSLTAFEAVKTEVQNITDPDYLNAKSDLAGRVNSVLGLDPYDVRTTLTANELVSADGKEFRPESKEAIPSIMALYLIHNQSFLTEARFLGFPFHYFYTAVFLLILFVGLCWLYCVRTDNSNGQLGIQETS
jgi:putative solute:sodium symporter small subunit